jgi:hypothetical protein
MAGATAIVALVDGAERAGIVAIAANGRGGDSGGIGSFRFASHPATSAAIAIQRIIGSSSCEAMIM